MYTPVTEAATRAGVLGTSLWLGLHLYALATSMAGELAMLTISLVEGWTESRKKCFGWNLEVEEKPHIYRLL